MRYENATDRGNNACRNDDGACGLWRGEKTEKAGGGACAPLTIEFEDGKTILSPRPRAPIVAAAKKAVGECPWRAEIRKLRSDAKDAGTTLIRNLISPELEDLHLTASAIAVDPFSSEEPDTPVDTSLRWTLEQILGEADDPLDA